MHLRLNLLVTGFGARGMPASCGAVYTGLEVVDPPVSKSRMWLLKGSTGMADGGKVYARGQEPDLGGSDNVKFARTPWYAWSRTI